MKTTAELINSLPWPGDSYTTAVVNAMSDKSFSIVYCDDTPHFNFGFGFWVSSGVSIVNKVKAEETADWKSTIIFRQQWLAAQRESVPVPQVGEKWQTSSGPVVIRYVEQTESSWECCARKADGDLDTYTLDQLKPMPTPEDDFLMTAIRKVDEHIQPEDTILGVAKLISAGELDAELAALGYTKTNQQ